MANAKLFASLCKSWGLPEPVLEHKFCETRKWRFDYGWPAYSVALEVEGGIFVRGRHSRGVGMLADMEKYNAAACDGWRVVRVTPEGLMTAKTCDMLRILLT